MDRFGCVAVQICNLNPEVALHSMLLALCSGMFGDSLCKTPPSSMDEFCERARCYIQMEDMSRFRNKVKQTGHKCDKWEESIKIDSHKSDKRHKPDKPQPLPKGPRYEHYTHLMPNHTIILEEAFNLEVPIMLPLTKPPRSGLDATKYCRYHHDIDNNIEDCWALKDKMMQSYPLRALDRWL